MVWHFLFVCLVYRHGTSQRNRFQVQVLQLGKFNMQLWTAKQSNTRQLYIILRYWHWQQCKRWRTGISSSSKYCFNCLCFSQHLIDTLKARKTPIWIHVIYKFNKWENFCIPFFAKRSFSFSHFLYIFIFKLNVLLKFSPFRQIRADWIQITIENSLVRSHLRMSHLIDNHTITTSSD